VTVPDAFLSYMSGRETSFVANEAGCACTNSVHAIVLNGRLKLREIQSRWSHPLTQLSCEVEGHPLGGGLLKLEPREASRVVLGDPATMLPDAALTAVDAACVMRSWRHHGP